LRKAKATELSANADLLKAQATAATISAQAAADLNAAEVKVKEAAADYQKAQAEQVRYAIETQKIKDAHDKAMNELLEKEKELSLKKDELDYEVELAALDAAKAAKIAEYNQALATAEAEVAKQEAIKASSIAALDTIADYFELRKAQISVQLLGAQQEATVAAWKLQFALIDAARERDSIDRAYVIELVSEYTTLLSDITTLEGQILSSKFTITINEAKLALAEQDATLAFGKYVEGLTSDKNDSVAKRDAKIESLKFWQNFNLDSLNTAKQPVLAAIYDTLTPLYVAALKVQSDAATALTTANTNFTNFKKPLDGFEYDHDDNPSTPPIYFDEYTATSGSVFGLDKGWKDSAKLAQAKVIAAVIESDLAPLKEEVAEQQKRLADTIKYLKDRVATIYLTAERNLKAAETSWKTAYETYIDYIVSSGKQDTAFFKVDSIYWERYAAFHGGTPRYHQQNTPNLNGVVNYGVRSGLTYVTIQAVAASNRNYTTRYTTPSSVTYTFAGASEEHARVDTIIIYLGKATVGGITALEAQLKGVKNIINVLESGQWKVYDDAVKAATSAKTAADREVSRIAGLINGKITIVKNLDKIALDGYGRTWDADNGIYYDPNPVLNASLTVLKDIAVSDIKDIIKGLEEEIDQLNDDIAYIQEKLDDINATIELVAGYYYYIDFSDPDEAKLVEQASKDLNITIAEAKAKLADQEATLSLKKAQVAKLKAEIDAVLAEED
jgi:hypothetical protein